MTNFVLDRIKAKSEQPKIKQVDLLGETVFFRELSFSEVSKISRGTDQLMVSLKLTVGGIYDALRDDSGELVLDEDKNAQVGDQLFKSKKDQAYFISDESHLTKGWRNSIMRDYTQWMLANNQNVPHDVISGYSGKNQQILDLAEQLNSLLDSERASEEESGN